MSSRGRASTMIVVAVGFAADGLGRSRESGCFVVMFILVLGGFFGCVCCCSCSSGSGSGGAVCGTGAVVVITVSFATERFRGRRERRGCSLLVLGRSRSRGSRRGYTGCSWSITVPGGRPLASGLERDDEQCYQWSPWGSQPTDAVGLGPGSSAPWVKTRVAKVVERMKVTVLSFILSLLYQKRGWMANRSDL